MGFKYSGFWIFSNTPHKWALDKFLNDGKSEDFWGCGLHQEKYFQPGQLAFIRAGHDRRTKIQREGRPRLKPGIYALCEVTSKPFPARGSSDEYTYGPLHSEGWPTVEIRYLESYIDRPLLIDTIKKSAPNIEDHIISGFQASSFPVSRATFDQIFALLHPDEAEALKKTSPFPTGLKELQDLENQLASAPPRIREVISKRIERGSIGERVKRHNEFKCQICVALGKHPHTFSKSNGEPYVEAHHVIPVSEIKAGVLRPTNILTVCANHHRQLHYGGTSVQEADDHWVFEIDGNPLKIGKPQLD